MISNCCGHPKIQMHTRHDQARRAIRELKRGGVPAQEIVRTVEHIARVEPAGGSIQEVDVPFIVPGPETGGGGGRERRQRRERPSRPRRERRRRARGERPRRRRRKGQRPNQTNRRRQRQRGQRSSNQLRQRIRDLRTQIKTAKAAGDREAKRKLKIQLARLIEKLKGAGQESMEAYGADLGFFSDIIDVIGDVIGVGDDGDGGIDDILRRQQKDMERFAREQAKELARRAKEQARADRQSDRSRRREERAARGGGKSKIWKGAGEVAPWVLGGAALLGAVAILKKK